MIMVVVVEEVKEFRRYSGKPDDVYNTQGLRENKVSKKTFGFMICMTV